MRVFPLSQFHTLINLLRRFCSAVYCWAYHLGTLLMPPVISQSCSAINISAQNEVILKMLTNSYIVRPSSCGGPEWTRAVYLKMSDPSQSCPSNWTLVNSPISGRTTVNSNKCDSV